MSWESNGGYSISLYIYKVNKYEFKDILVDYSMSAYSKEFYVNDILLQVHSFKWNIVDGQVHYWYYESESDDWNRIRSYEYLKCTPVGVWLVSNTEIKELEEYEYKK